MKLSFQSPLIIWIFFFSIIIGSLTHSNMFVLLVFSLYNLYNFIKNYKEKSLIYYLNIIKNNKIILIFSIFLLWVLFVGFFNFVKNYIELKIFDTILLENTILYLALFINVFLIIEKTNPFDYLISFKLISILLAIFGIIEALSGFNIFQFLYTNNNFASELGRIRSIFGYANHYAIFNICALVVIILKPFKNNHFNIISFILVSLALFFTQTRSALISYIFIILFILIKRIYSNYTLNINFKENYKSYLLIFLFILIFYFCFSSTINSYLELFIKRICDIFDSTPVDGSKSVRINNIYRAIQYLIAYPYYFIVGGGAGWGKIFMQISPYVGTTGAIWTTAIDNQYLTILLEFGIIGIIIFVYLCFNFLKKSIISSYKSISYLSCLVLLGICINFVFLEGLGINNSIYFNFIVFIFFSSFTGKISTKNIILLDILPTDNWTFKDDLIHHTKQFWQLLYWNNGLELSTINRYCGYIVHSWSIFINRQFFNTIIAWQQFYGLFFAFYSRLFKIKKRNKLIIMTFIYKEKKGLFGIIYYNFIKYCVCSKYIDYILCFSKKEVIHYKNIFSESSNKFYAINLGIEKIDVDNLECFSDKETYYISAGRSNRDYDTLFKIYHNPNKLLVICDGLSSPKNNKNIIVLHKTYNNDYLKLLKNAEAVIIFLDNINISSGQLVILQAMQLKVPIIISKSNALQEYIIHNKNALVINKNNIELNNALKKIKENKTLRNSLIENGYKMWKENFSMTALANQVSKFV